MEAVRWKKKRQKCEMVVDLRGYNGLITTRGYTGEDARGVNAGMDKYRLH